jgi:hypothetical protein
MATTVLQKIRDRFLPGSQFPPPDLAAVWSEIERYIAFRTSDATRLRMEESIPWFERYLLSPVPRMVSRAKANLLFGEPAEVTPANDTDADNLERLISENELDTEAHRSAVVSSSEGEVWGRIVVRPDVLDVPIIEFVSRRRVIPHFAGRFVIGATFVTEWPIDSTRVNRLFETYDRGAVAAQLWAGTRTSLGLNLSLDSFEPTKGMQQIVYTGIDQPLVAFVPNSIDDNPSRGFSDYRGLEERFFAINRATTIGDHNTDLAGKQRALVDAKYVDANGRALAGADVFVRHSDAGDIDESAPLQMIDYSYNADGVTTWLDHLIDSTLSFGGTSPQLVGRQLDGAAVSGVALRLKMIHSLLEASGAGRYADRGMRRLITFAQMIDSRPTTFGGFGRKWASPSEPPGFERQDGLPRDDLEAATVLATVVGAEAISVAERVAFLHPDWSQERIDEEVATLESEAKQVAERPITLPRA